MAVQDPPPCESATIYSKFSNRSHSHVGRQDVDGKNRMLCARAILIFL